MGGLSYALPVGTLTRRDFISPNPSQKRSIPAYTAAHLSYHDAALLHRYLPPHGLLNAFNRLQRVVLPGGYTTTARAACALLRPHSWDAYTIAFTHISGVATPPSGGRWEWEPSCLGYSLTGQWQFSSFSTPASLLPPFSLLPT